MQNIKLTLEYDGTRYRGFSGKDGADTVSERLKCALSQITEEEPLLFAAVKTDAGVHASAQTVNVQLSGAPETPDTLQRKLNRYLPMDIAVREAVPVPERFHAALHLTSCTYICRIDTGAVPNPFTRNYCMHLPEALDIERIAEASSLLCRTLDFAAFSCGRTKKRTVRTLTELTLSSSPEGDELRFILTADGFLRGMPQRIVGTLLAVGRGQREVSDIPRILAGEMPCPIPAPSKAFCLTETCYL